MTEPPAISIVFATVRGWPHIQPALDALREQATRHGAEVLVGDASDGPDFPATAAWPGLRRIELPGASVFEMRMRLLGEARGDVVAVTEDHCRPRGDWVEAILRAHAERPDAAGVGGAVQNGTTERAIDWAAFLLTQWPSIRPGASAARPVLSAANMSLKRRAVERLLRHAGDRTVVLVDPAVAAGADDVIVADDRIVVNHDQSLGVVGTTLIEFHNGRSVGGSRHGAMRPADWLRLGGTPALVVLRTIRAVRSAVARGIPRPVVARSTGWIGWLALADAAGQVAGYLAGPGRSPWKLR